MEERLNSKTLYVDVRNPHEYELDSLIGAINIPLQQIIPSKEIFYGYEKIVVFCQTGNRSDAAVGLLKYLGFENVVDGGALEDLRTNNKVISNIKE